MDISAPNTKYCPPLYDDPQTGDQCGIGSDCLCTPEGTCYPLEQNMYINNCLIKDLRGHFLKLTYTVINNAKLETAGEHNVEQPFDTKLIAYRLKCML